MTDRELELESENAILRERLNRHESSETESPDADEQTGRTQIDDLQHYVEVVEYVKGALDAIQTTLASNDPPPWAKRLFAGLTETNLRVEAVEKKQQALEERLARLPCWKHTLPPPCPELELLEGGKGE